MMVIASFFLNRKHLSGKRDFLDDFEFLTENGKMDNSVFIRPCNKVEVLLVTSIGSHLQVYGLVPIAGAFSGAFFRCLHTFYVISQIATYCK